MSGGKKPANHWFYGFASLTVKPGNEADSLRSLLISSLGV